MNAAAHGATPLPKLLAAALYAKSIILDCAHKFVRRRVRTRAQVDADYDQGAWRGKLDSARWNTVAGLEDYVYSTSTENMRAHVDGRLSSIPMKAYYRYRADRLTSLLTEFDLGEGTIIEIGCGAGQNLFAASLAGRWREIRGLDLSRTAIEIVTKVATRFKLNSVSVGPIDLLDPTSPGYSELRGAVVFTHYCLEQLPAHTEQVLRTLASAGVRRVIHIEPTLEFFKYTSLQDLASIAYIWRQDYLADLVSTALALEAQNVLKIVQMRRLDFSPTLRNTPTLVVWEPSSPPKQTVARDELSA